MPLTPADFAGPAARLAPGDLTAAAAVLKVSLPAIQAVEKVESCGRGFHPDSKRPIILFEPHIFSKLTGGKFDKGHPDISYGARWSKPYPATQTGRYDQLLEAMALDETHALCAASWGLFQIMGYHHQICGFTTAQNFVQAMVRSEGEQLMAFARFVGAQPAMASALRAKDWHAFAREYNGPAYAAHAYDQKLKTAYQALTAPKAA